jgi:hypothetical protein
VRGGRAFSSRESSVVSRQESGLRSDIWREFRYKPEFGRVGRFVAGRFRPLFAVAQSMALLKLANPLAIQWFLVFRRRGRAPPKPVMVCRE